MARDMMQAQRDREWQARVVGQMPVRPWLQERGSLTARLKRHYADFSVEILSQAWRKPHPDERALLGVAPETQAWVREVMLHGQGRPQVFAHSVIARRHLRGPWRHLRRMGRVPLGAALFANARVQRGALHYRKLPATHPLRASLLRYLPASSQNALWARRSLFCLGPYRLLVTEVFLPQALDESK